MITQAVCAWSRIRDRCPRRINFVTRSRPNLFGKKTLAQATVTAVGVSWSSPQHHLAWAGRHFEPCRWQGSGAMPPLRTRGARKQAPRACRSAAFPAVSAVRHRRLRPAPRDIGATAAMQGCLLTSRAIHVGGAGVGAAGKPQAQSCRSMSTELAWGPQASHKRNPARVPERGAGRRFVHCHKRSLCDERDGERRGLEAERRSGQRLVVCVGGG